MDQPSAHQTVNVKLKSRVSLSFSQATEENVRGWHSGGSTEFPFI
jgi:hypothetical protein